jgi:CO/xanthine dehydrogenase FAD-binding subunit
VKPPPFEYHRPHSVAEALRLKSDLAGDAAILAGGQSLVPLMNMRMAQPQALIDLGRVEELAYIRRTDTGLHVGAMTRTRDLERSEPAFEACPLLREAITHVAHPVIRNRGTIGGSVAHADPAAEVPAVLALLGGSVVASGPDGSRDIAADRFFRGHFTTDLNGDELLTEVRFPEPPVGAGYAFAESARRHGDFAVAGVGVLAWAGGVRIVMFGVDSRPVVVESSDVEVALREIAPTEDIHGSQEYRRAVVRALLGPALAKAQEGRTV